MSQYKDYESFIRNYLSEIDFANENFSLAQIKADLKEILHQEPAVHIKRVAYGELNEATRKLEQKNRISVVTISYIDGETENGLPLVKRLPLLV